RPEPSLQRLPWYSRRPVTYCRGVSRVRGITMTRTVQSMDLSVDEARMSSHAVCFYDSDAGLSDQVGDFLGAGLRAGESAVVIATEPHLGLFVRRLEERHHEV